MLHQIQAFCHANDINEDYLNEISDELLANAAMKSQNYQKALFHYERLCKKIGDENKERYIYQIQKIFSEMHDQDGMTGVGMVISNPKIENQILEHECCGNWTAAQSCYEILLSNDQKSLKNQIGLVKCLQRLGLFETLNNMLGSLIVKNEEYVDSLRPYQAETLWKLGKWDDFEKTTEKIETKNFNISIGQLVLSSINGSNEKFENIYSNIIDDISSLFYSRTNLSYRDLYDGILKSHLLVDLKMFPSDFEGRDNITMDLWKNRLNMTSTAFSIREPILNLHRLLIESSKKKESDNLVKDAALAKIWLDLAKLSRKSGFKQTAYSALLHASELDAYCSHIEKAKYLWSDGEHQKAMKELVNFLKNNSGIMKEGTEDFGETKMHTVTEMNMITAKVSPIFIVFRQICF